MDGIAKGVHQEEARKVIKAKGLVGVDLAICEGFAVVAVVNLLSALVVYMVDSGRRSVTDPVALTPYPASPFDILKPRKFLVKRMALPGFSSNCRVCVVAKRHLIIVDTLGRKPSREYLFF